MIEAVNVVEGILDLSKRMLVAQGYALWGREAVTERWVPLAFAGYQGNQPPSGELTTRYAVEDVDQEDWSEATKEIPRNRPSGFDGALRFDGGSPRGLPPSRTPTPTPRALSRAWPGCWPPIHHFRPSFGRRLGPSIGPGDSQCLGGRVCAGAGLAQCCGCARIGALPVCRLLG